MKRLLLLLTLGLSSATLFAQGRRIAVSVADTTVLPQLLLPGSSTASLTEYSAKAAAGRGEFIFEYAQVPSIGVCRYHITCSGGTVTAVEMVSRAQQVPASLGATLQQRYGDVARENTEKNAGQVTQQTFLYRKGNENARLDVSTNRGWLFSAR